MLGVPAQTRCRSRHTRCLGFYAGGLWLLVAVSSARADSRSHLAQVVHVDPGATCLDAGVLIEHIVSWLGTDQVDPGLSIEVVGSTKFSRFVSFRIARHDAELAERRFEPGPARCEDLHAALGLAIALACKATVLNGLVDL